MPKNCKLDSHKSAFCHVIVHEDGVNLVSYETSVCEICVSKDRKSGYILCSGNYSRSTIKHIGWFTQEFCGKNMYHEIRWELTEAVRHNKLVYNEEISGTLLYNAMVRLNQEQIDHCMKRINWYYENAKRFNGYSKEPNYDFNMYGYRRMNPIILP